MRTRWTTWALCALLAAAPAGAADDAADAAWRATMDRIFAAMQVALPMSLDEERFADPAERETLSEALALLAAHSDQLEAHGRSRDAGLAYLSRSLARDARDVQLRYESGRPAEARFLLQELTSTCVACHSRLPAGKSFPLGERFVEETVVAALPLDERARFETATRQFDAALATHEALFVALEVTPDDVSLMGHVDDYLEIALRVKSDPARARRALMLYSEREEMSPSLRANVQAWIASLAALEQRTPLADPVADARDLFAKGTAGAKGTSARRSLVWYVAASAALQRYVAGQTEPSERLAEAYWLLGQVESRIGRALWLSESEVYLEWAIRMAPKSEFAPSAFALLEEIVRGSWTGSGGEHVPPDVERRLDGLRVLVEAAPASAAPSR